MFVRTITPCFYQAFTLHGQKNTFIGLPTTGHLYLVHLQWLNTHAVVNKASTTGLDSTVLQKVVLTT